MGLAEARRKQRISVDPRNETWSRDTTKFGYRLMQKMGWATGTGLGKSGEGMTEHIKIRKKEDSRGVGATKNSIDAWLDNTSAFDSLLRSLNESQTEQESPESTSSQGEVKVHHNHRHAHRKKFVRNKTVSNYDSEGLSMILGSKRKRLEQDDLDLETSSASEVDSRSSSMVTPTITASVSSTDYFAAKMKLGLRLKRSLDVEGSGSRELHFNSIRSGFGLGTQVSLSDTFSASDNDVKEHKRGHFDGSNSEEANGRGLDVSEERLSKEDRKKLKKAARKALKLADEKQR